MMYARWMYNELRHFEGKVSDRRAVRTKNSCGDRPIVTTKSADKDQVWLRTPETLHQTPGVISEPLVFLCLASHNGWPLSTASKDV
jgi:hypothetical protein